MAYGDIGAVIDTLEFNTIQGMDCWGIHVAGNVYAVAYQGPSGFLNVTTFEIAADGNIGAAVIDTQVFSSYWGVLPQIVHISGSVFAMVYQGVSYRLTVQTISIADDGTIGASIEILELNALDSRCPKIIHVAGSVYAISYIELAATSIKVCTVDISSGGDINAIIDSITLTTAGNYYSTLVKVAAGIFAVQYNDTVDGTTVDTISIAEDGNIGAAVIDTQIIAAATTVLAEGMTEALSGVFAIAHVGTDLDGFISTVTIGAGGEISTVVDSLEFLATDVTQIHILHVGDGICAITFKDANVTDGRVSTVQTDASGNIDGAIIDSLAFEGTSYIDGMLLHISGDIYAAFYGANGPDGYVKTLDISTPPAAPPERPHHEMIMGMGQ